jgi:hypothetical protein
MRSRTSNLRFWRPALCQLSYAPRDWWRRWGSNPRHPTCKAGVLPLNYTPSLQRTSDALKTGAGDAGRTRLCRIGGPAVLHLTTRVVCLVTSADWPPCTGFGVPLFARRTGLRPASVPRDLGHAVAWAGAISVGAAYRDDCAEMLYCPSLLLGSTPQGQVPQRSANCAVWWVRLDSNQRGPEAADLQSTPFDRFGTHPDWSPRSDSN